MLPFAAFFLVLVHQTIEHFTAVRFIHWFHHFLSQILFYGAIGPLLAWFTPRWILKKVREKDQAEGHLRCLYEVNRQAAAAVEMEPLVEMALQIPEMVVRPVGTRLLLRGHPEGPWVLAGTRLLSPDQRTALEAHIAAAGPSLRCGGCATLTATPQQECALLPLLQKGPGPPVGSVICLPLSTEHPSPPC